MKLATSILTFLLCLSCTTSMPVSDNDAQLAARAPSSKGTTPPKTSAVGGKASAGPSKGPSAAASSKARPTASGKSAASGAKSSVKSAASGKASASGSKSAASGNPSVSGSGFGSAISMPSATVSPTGVDPLAGDAQAPGATVEPAAAPSGAKGDACMATVQGGKISKRCDYDRFVINSNGKSIYLPLSERISSRESAGIWIVNGRVYKVYSSTSTMNRVSNDLDEAEEYGLPVGNAEVRSGRYYPAGGRGKDGFVVISRPATGLFVQASVSSSVSAFKNELRDLDDNQVLMLLRVMEGAVYAGITDGQGFLDSTLRSPFQFIDVHIGRSSNCQVLVDACKAEARARRLIR